MSRDYKRAAKTATKRQRSEQRRKRGATGTTAALWLTAGLAIGLGLGLAGWFMAENRAAHSKNAAAVAANVKTPETAPKKSPATAASRVEDPWHFDFYQLLPKMEVVISDEELESAKSELSKERPHGPYILQVGSFRHFSDADALKARLALLGIQAGIESIVVDNGNSWNRVRIGPFADIKRLKPVRRKLEHEQIAFIMIELNNGKK